MNFLIGRGEFLVTADSPSAENYFLMASRLSDSLKNKVQELEGEALIEVINNFSQKL